MQYIILKIFPVIINPSEKPKRKRLKNIDRLVELAFYEQVSAIITFKPLQEMQCHIKLK